MCLPRLCKFSIIRRLMKSFAKLFMVHLQLEFTNSGIYAELELGLINNLLMREANRRVL